MKPKAPKKKDSKPTAKSGEVREQQNVRGTIKLNCDIGRNWNEYTINNLYSKYFFDFKIQSDGLIVPIYVDIDN